MPRYLVTGAAGFLGYYVAEALAQTPSNYVVCVDNFCRGQNDEPYQKLVAKPNVQHITADLTDKDAVARLPDEVDIVFHLAALNGTQNFYTQPFEVVRCCTLPTIFLVEKYAGVSLRRFVYAGTSEAYASTVTRFEWPVPTAEDVPLCIDDVLNPRWSYGASKLHGEVATVNGCNHSKTPFTIIRFHNAYGPRMGDKHVIPDFLTRARAGVFELYGYEDTRSFIYAEDAARATIALAQADGAASQVVNVGSEDEIKILELGRLMMEACGSDQNIVLHPSPQGSVRRRAPDISKLKELTGYSPVWTLEAGLTETAEFYLR